MPISNLTNIRCLLPLVLFVALTGCKEETIRTYRVAKDPTLQPAIPAAADAVPSAFPEWKVPETWASQPPSAMRLASFRAGEADVSVSKMPGTAGGTLANVNRWRGQIGLAPLTESELATEQKAIEVGGENSLLFEMAGGKAPEGKSQPQRTLAAIVPHSGETWFFKMSGDSAAVANESVNFAAFLKSIRFK